MEATLRHEEGPLRHFPEATLAGPSLRPASRRLEASGRKLTEVDKSGLSERECQCFMRPKV